ncbi:MAG: DUF3160 domain-containing protein [candidate division KSB1 bacterium]|nr:DUF3160 domain-containing protein [candidate division KSB1 bacterium]MDZ7303948.1 DUF3160 domain-containing protein [candidate division KSB1 bacterium]MDZ7313109.1 DUF3160 domain-containing protein [candidate division KSB1 bacterium]
MRKLRLLAGMITLLCLGVFGSEVKSQMLAQITEAVETDFGWYHPYAATFVPNVPAFSVKPDFSNVVNFSNQWGFSATDSTLLLQNHFTVKKSQYQQLYDIYNACTWNGMPIFVTTDAVLHTYHVLFDRFLAEIEVRKFVEALFLLTETLIDSTQSVFTQSTKSETREAAHRNLAFLCVAKKLLVGANVTIPATVSALVDSELALIAQQDGFHYSPILGNFSALDYSQFQPRGHYTKSDTLKAFFRAMMWYGWTIFTMEPQRFGDLARRHTLQALMLMQMIYRLEAQGQPLLDLWKKIYEPTVFFVGKTDDPNVKNYRAIADQIYGNNFLSLAPDSLANTSLLDVFMTEAQKLPEPKIPNYIYGTTIRYKGFRLMGQRFVPDSYMFAHLVFPEVGDRLFPKGLDLMAILGSTPAFHLLDSLYQETSYPNYREKIAQFNAEFTAKTPEEWAQNLYWNWLYCLMPLLYKKGAGYPFFMQTEAWSNKELLAALASWAELRHDTILYAKQSMTPCGITPGPPRSYVEPNPHLYARLASLVRYTREGLQSFDLLLNGFQDKLDLFEKLLLFLRDVSIKELENIPLSQAEYENIFCFGKVMQTLVSVVKDPQRPWESDTDDMAVIADVHTDSNTRQCLEEGVGYPLEIFVIVNEGGTIRLTRGAMFSYYEFTQPIANRLTDEAWRELLTGDSPPKMPEWVASFMDMKASSPPFVTDSPANLYHKEFTTVVVREENQIPKVMRLFPNYPNPFNPGTTIEFYLPKGGFITIAIYDLNGRLVKQLADGYYEAGLHKAVWNGRDQHEREVASGVYIYSLKSVGLGESKKMIKLR